MNAEFFGLVETAMGPTFVRAIGSGPMVFVVHGGPGFDHRYLLPALDELSQRRKLVFFDQPGCGQTPSTSELTAELTFAHFAALRRALAPDGPVGLVAHSWGALVAIASARAERTPFVEGLLITPVPLTNREYDICRGNLLSRVPPEKLAEFGRMAANGDSENIVRLLLPYYYGPAPQTPVNDLRIDMATFTAVAASMGTFDFTADLECIGRLNVVLGEFDFTRPGLVGHLTGSAARTDIMKGVGHFPFAEDPAAFAVLLDAAFPN